MEVLKCGRLRTSRHCQILPFCLPAFIHQTVTPGWAGLSHTGLVYHRQVKVSSVVYASIFVKGRQLLLAAWPELPSVVTDGPLTEDASVITMCVCVCSTVHARSLLRT